MNSNKNNPYIFYTPKYLALAKDPTGVYGYTTGLATLQPTAMAAFYVLVSAIKWGTQTHARYQPVWC